VFILLSHKIDISSPFYGGRKGFSYEPTSLIKKGDTANTQKWMFPNHLGTHIDLPYHFHQNGQTIEDFPIDSWIIDGKKIQTLEVNIPENEFLIKPEPLENKIDLDVEFLILKTGFGTYRNQEKYWKFNPGLSLEAAVWIKDNLKKLRFIGLDSISISSWQHRDIGRKVHKTMLEPTNPCLIVEDMDLSNINENTLFEKIIISPLMVRESDGGPCTIFAEVKK
jgi:kynurenine formamidase